MKAIVIDNISYKKGIAYTPMLRNIMGYFTSIVHIQKFIEKYTNTCVLLKQRWKLKVERRVYHYQYSLCNITLKNTSIQIIQLIMTGTINMNLNMYKGMYQIFLEYQQHVEITSNETIPLNTFRGCLSKWLNVKMHCVILQIITFCVPSNAHILPHACPFF